jgi:hypothetical protein
VYEHLDSLQRSDLLSLVLDEVTVRATPDGSTNITIKMWGEAPELGRYKKGADGKFHQPLTGLPK